MELIAFETEYEQVSEKIGAFTVYVSRQDGKPVYDNENDAVRQWDKFVQAVKMCHPIDEGQ